ncbi:unnamed protein product [Acanthoscelides obtectus]|uniref:Regulatory protein zeste n=1 Tax=Acanthoscelides obtectus TaxID=200917 RepID=A0A9P0KD50_ACAOB|nr:unnamed protein product [Acanthoscelides obtectus]CAH1984327.1 unnamed protein product [Acanthoscelides obtectus]CAK1626376.1 hypothetical protein AOBTE_LOCUS3810 [Acanthoscelides obtectus]CAK1641949.1 hypothetical protein AOBTE_LOCUS12749 [Acanthoscelides obtectus]
MSRKQISILQKTMLIDFLEDHPELVSQKQTNQYTSADARKLWVELSEKLNAIPGATKQWTEWRKTWTDMKTRAKRKKSENKKEASQTGGGPSSAESLNEIDDKVLEIMGGEILIEGLQVPELGLLYTLPKEAEVGEVPVCKSYPVHDNDDKDKENLCPNNIKEKNLKRVRPPHGTKRCRQTNSIPSSVHDLVAAQLQLNQIKENYYKKKIEVLERIASSSETIAKKYAS